VSQNVILYGCIISKFSCVLLCRSTLLRFVVAGAGAVDHTQLVDLSEKYFGKLPTAPKSGAQVVMDPAVFTGSDKLIRFDSMKEAHVALAYEGASWSSEFAFPLMVIQTLLGSWDRSSPAGNNIASRLARDIAENDAADSFMTFNTCYKVSRCMLSLSFIFFLSHIVP
jgi:processing peptidase subunit beta